MENKIQDLEDKLLIAKMELGEAKFCVSDMIEESDTLEDLVKQLKEYFVLDDEHYKEVKALDNWMENYLANENKTK